MPTPPPLPDHEPSVRVGIVLPEEQRAELTVTSPGSDDPLHFRAAGDELSVNGRPHPDYTIKPSADEAVPVLHDLRAGRSFHWEQAIDLRLPGALEFRAVNGALLVVNVLPLECYLSCVATSEMSAACPPALLQTQTVAARSWLLAAAERKHARWGVDVCNDDCCQRYHGLAGLTPQAATAVQTTRGQVLLFAGVVCDARYSKSCGGRTETAANVWGGSSRPYLTSVSDAPAATGQTDLSVETNLRRWIDAPPPCYCGPDTVPEMNLIRYLGVVDQAGRYFRWEVAYNQDELTDLLNRKMGLTAQAIVALQPRRRGASGRILTLEIAYLDRNGHTRQTTLTSEYAIRQALHPSFLYSSAFYVTITPAGADLPERFIFRGGGWGHGVGLCQIGALGQALQGRTCAEILRHYYPGTTLKKIYD